MPYDHMIMNWLLGNSLHLQPVAATCHHNCHFQTFLPASQESQQGSWKEKSTCLIGINLPYPCILLQSSVHVPHWPLIHTRQPYSTFLTHPMKYLQALPRLSHTPCSTFEPCHPSMMLSYTFKHPLQASSPLPCVLSNPPQAASFASLPWHIFTKPHCIPLHLYSLPHASPLLPLLLHTLAPSPTWQQPASLAENCLGFATSCQLLH